MNREYSITHFIFLINIKYYSVVSIAIPNVKKINIGFFAVAKMENDTENV